MKRTKTVRARHARRVASLEARKRRTHRQRLGDSRFYPSEAAGHGPRLTAMIGAMLARQFGGRQ